VTDSEFGMAFEQHKNVVYRFAYRVTGSEAEAEDVAQEAFLALWKQPDSYQMDRGTLRAYLLGIARKLMLKRWRSRRPHELLDDEAIAEQAVYSPLDCVGVERSQAVASAIGRLPLLQREVLVLAEYEELKLEEISNITGAELAAVKSRLHRARQNLRRMLAGLLEAKEVNAQRGSK
jgi:RNA polymerase sigma-70 factor (ECF subfamily)